MSKKNKIYWLEGVTEKGVKALLADQNPRYRWLRVQRNRRILVILVGIGNALVAMGSYWPTLKTDLNISEGAEITIFSLTAIFVIFAALGGYLLLRISVRGIADAPSELLDERQVKVRDTSYRYAYYIMGFLVMVLLIVMLFGPEVQIFQTEGNDGSYLYIALMFTFAAMPSMILGWREKDI